MDKYRIYDDKKKAIVHQRLKKMTPIHQKYGLMIAAMGSGTTQPDSFNQCPVRYFEHYSLSHCFDGKGRLWLPPNYQKDISPGQCVVMPPNHINRYGGNKVPYSEDRLTFFGPVADQMFNSGIIECGVFYLGHTRRLLHIGELLADPAQDAQLEANFELQSILFEMWRNKQSSIQKTDDPIVLLLKEIRANLNRWWTVAEMAEFCCLSDDQLRRRFIKNTGMRPKEYLSHIKMNRASELLQDSSASLVQIGEQLGYHDQFHFSRRFKAVIGISPSQYRLQQLEQ